MRKEYPTKPLLIKPSEIKHQISNIFTIYKQNILHNYDTIIHNLCSDQDYFYLEKKINLNLPRNFNFGGIIIHSDKKNPVNNLLTFVSFLKAHSKHIYIFIFVAFKWQGRIWTRCNTCSCSPSE